MNRFLIAVCTAICCISSIWDAPLAAAVPQCPPEAAIAPTVGMTNGPLTKNPGEAFFRDASDHPVYLVGSHTWDSLQDWGDFRSDFDYEAYLDMMQSCGHNFMRLWTFEGPANELPTGAWNPQISPMPWKRVTGGSQIGLGSRGGNLVFDVDPNNMNPSFLSRLSQRVNQARQRGIYVSVMLFQGWSVHQKITNGGPNPWPSHPLHAGNSRQEIEGLYSPPAPPPNDTDGRFLHRLPRQSGTEIVTDIHHGFIGELFDSLASFDNVLWEVCNECDKGASTEAWQYDILATLDTERNAATYRHPIGMTSTGFGSSNTVLLNSIADWISPSATGGYAISPPIPDGSKVIISDTDHMEGILLADDVVHRKWIWKNATRGINTIIMDEVQNPFSSQYANANPTSQAAFALIRQHLGRARHFVDLMDLRSAVPKAATSDCGSGFCLVDDTNLHYLVYDPNGGVQTVRVAAGSYLVEWLRPSDGSIIVEPGTRDVAAPTLITETPPSGFGGGDVVLFLSGEPLVPTEPDIAVHLFDNGVIGAEVPQGTTVTLPDAPPFERSLAIRNLGDGPLDITSASINDTCLRVVDVAAQVPAGGFDEVKVENICGGDGDWNLGTLSISTNDPNEGLYLIEVASHTLFPDTYIYYYPTDGIPITKPYLPHGFTHDVGVVGRSYEWRFYFSIANTGTGDLAVFDFENALTGSSCFFLSQLPDPMIPPSEFSLFMMEFACPTGAEQQVAVLDVQSTDPNRPSYVINFQANVDPSLHEEIEVWTVVAGSPDQVISPGGTFTFPPTASGTPISRVFLIRNTGTSPLVILNHEGMIDGVGFSQITDPSRYIGPGAESSFRVRFMGSNTGSIPIVKTGTITVVSTDGDRSPYTITIDGTILDAD